MTLAVDKQTLGAAIAICGTGGGGGGGDITVDSSISHFSRNPVQNRVIADALDEKVDKANIDAVPTENSENPVQSGGVYAALVGNLDPLLPSILNAKNYVSTMKLWFSINGAAALTDYSSLCDRWYSITRTGWTGGTRFYHWPGSGSGEGTKVGDNAGMIAEPSTNDTAGRDDYQAVPLFHCLDCNWTLDGSGAPHITAIEGVCGNFERNNPDKLVGVIQTTGWHRYVEDTENDVFTHMYTDEIGASGYHPLPEAVNPDGTVRTWVVHAKYAAGDDYGCYSGVHPWTYTASHNSAITAFHNKWGNQYGGKTSADDAFLKLMFYLKYANLSADGVLQGCVAYNYQYAVAETETGVERVILTAAQAANIKVGSTVMVGNPTAFSSGTTLNIGRSQAGMRAKADRKKVTRKENLSSGNVAVCIDNGGTTFDTTANTFQGTKTIGPSGVVAIDDAVGGTASGLTVNIAPVQSGSGDPSPDNVRPISGWTGAKVTRIGVNVWDEQWEQGFINAQGENEANTHYIRSKGYIPIKPNTKYFYHCPTSYSDYGRFKYYDAKKHFVGQIGTSTVVNNVFTTPNDACYMRFTTGENIGEGVIYNSDISINYPATDTNYHTYAGKTINITFPSEAGTVYGGTLDVVNGTLTVDRAIIDLGELTWIDESDLGLPGQFRVPSNPTINQFAFNAIPVCSILKGVGPKEYSKFDDGEIGLSNIESSPILRAKSSVFIDMTADELTAYLSGQYLCSELTTPITYPLTPQEIMLLIGNNAIFADCGNVTLQYTANIPAPTYISTSPWYTGTCDNVKGVDGSPTSPGNDTEPVILQGIEYALGAYEVVCDAILKYYKDSSDKYHLTVYVCRDASKYSTGVTSDYELVDYEVDCPASNSWRYIAELGYHPDHPEAWFPHLIGCTSSQRTKDAIYILATSTNVYEWLSLGGLGNGLGNGVGAAGLSVVRTDDGLSYSYWQILARLSATGTRGTYNGGGN